MCICELKNVSKKIQSNSEMLTILKQINFVVKKEEFVSIMGESGSGKSTLLYLMGLLDYPSDGKVYINGTEVSSLNDTEQSQIRRKYLGFVFQSYNLIPTLSVEDNILVPIYLDKQDKKKYKVKMEEILEIIGLSDKKGKMPNELSGGEQQRVAIGRSLIHNPELILLDEPVGNLDSKNAKIIMELLHKLNREEKKTIIQVTHSFEYAKYGSKIYKMQDGKLTREE